jgi:hypothetical protein
MTFLRVGVSLVLCAPVIAFAWTYSPVISVSETHQARTFVHLESSGNRSIAISKEHIAITWEDNHTGKPEVYVAFKALNAPSFSAALRVSETGPAYESALAGLGDGRFLVVWEANDHIWSRVVSEQQRGSVQRLSAQVAREATVSTNADGQLWLAWAAKNERYYQIVAARATLQGNQIKLAGVKPVDPALPKQDQLYPSMVVTSSGTSVGWEDRRYGHTRLFTAFAPIGKWFGPLRQLNKLKDKRSNTYGNGTGAMRVVLASDDAQQVLASWLDKRDFDEGYDVYAAVALDGGKTFAGNEKVQDMLGANQPQWHAVSAMDNLGHAVVAWDDQRDGSPDVWMSWRKGDGWSDNDSPAGANGKGAQSHPAMMFDMAGRLHLTFLDRGEGYTAIRYLVATPSPTEYGASP